MASIQDLVDLIVENVGTDKRLEIPGVADEKEYHTIRTGLVRKWVEQREVIRAIAGDADPLAELSLCGNYDSSSQAARFWLGTARRKMAKSYTFSIVSNDNSSATDGVTSNDTQRTSSANN